MNWFQKDRDNNDHKWQDYIHLSPDSRKQIEAIQKDLSFAATSTTSSQVVLLGAVTVTSFALGYRLGKVRPVWRQIKALQDLSSSDIGASAPWLRGKVVSVSDGDTFRFVHQPTWFHSTNNNNKSNNKQQQQDDGDGKMAIRVCTIDTPETAKFGKPGQPYGEEAKDYLKSLCLDKMVRIKVLQIDQYGRGVAEVKKGKIWSTYLDEAMLSAGLAEVYQGSGAVYGRLGKDKYLAIAENAKKKKKGIWKDANRESAAEYKRRVKAEEAA